jgi:hypothetical protein
VSLQKLDFEQPGGGNDEWAEEERGIEGIDEGGSENLREDIPLEPFLIDARMPAVPMKFVDSEERRPFHSLCKLGESLLDRGR